MRKKSRPEFSKYAVFDITHGGMSGAPVVPGLYGHLVDSQCQTQGYNLQPPKYKFKKNFADNQKNTIFVKSCRPKAEMISNFP